MNGTPKPLSVYPAITITPTRHRPINNTLIMPLGKLSFWTLCVWSCRSDSLYWFDQNFCPGMKQEKMMIKSLSGCNKTREISELMKPWSLTLSKDTRRKRHRDTERREILFMH